MSSMSTCFASSFSVNVFERDSGVMPVVLATFSACVSISAAEGEFMLAYDLMCGRARLDDRAERSREGLMKRCMDAQTTLPVLACLHQNLSAGMTPLLAPSADPEEPRIFQSLGYRFPPQKPFRNYLGAIGPGS